MSIWGQIHIHIDKKKTPSPYHGIWGGFTSDDEVMPTLIFPHGLRHNTEAYIKWLKEALLFESWGCLLEDLWQQDSAQCHTSRITQYWQSEKFCDHITPTSGHLIPLIVILLIIMCQAWLSERLTKLNANTKDELKAKITVVFTNLNKETVGKADRRFRSRLTKFVL